MLRYPLLSEDEKAARLDAVQEFYAALRVKATELELRAFLNATCDVPWPLFRQALVVAVRRKSDGYQTAPQPGEVIKIAVELTPTAQRDYSPTQGLLEPRWARAARRREYLLAAGSQEAPQALEDRAGATNSGNGH